MQTIFEDDEDCEKMLQTLADVKSVSKFKLFAYCLMKNHCHLLLKEEEEGLDQIFKRIGARYVYWYNLKYKRAGHLYQDRFKSEAVENDKYFLDVLRYIHQNPIKAGICENLSDYEWSSYMEYIEADKTRGSSVPQVISKTQNRPMSYRNLVDTTHAFKLLNNKDFKEYSNKESTEKILEYENNKFRVSDSDAKKIITIISKCNNTTEFQQINPHERRIIINKLKDEGMSIRQISRLTGVSKGIVERT